MRCTWKRVAVVSAASVAGVIGFSLPAGAHAISDFAVSCQTVSATISDTGTQDLNDHPITWHVTLGNSPSQAVVTTETQVGPPDQDVHVVTGDISSLTANLQGETATVQAFATWPSNPAGTDTFTGSVTCGTPPTTAVPPSTVAGGAQVSPESAGRAAATAAAPAPVIAASRFTG